MEAAPDFEVGSSMIEPARAVLRECLQARIDEAQSAWLDGQLSALAADPSDRNLDIALGMAPRRLGKAALDAGADARRRLADLVPGWSLADWSVADAARVLLLAGLPAAGFAGRFASRCRSADVGEAVALYRGLPLYPEPEALEPQVGEGLRTNVRAVFDAIAHGNPYPQRHFDEHRWNHMVLKALYEELARILIDFARERRAAGRPVPWELWRCVGPFARGPMLDDLARALEGTNGRERGAAALALAKSPDPAAAALLDRAPELRDAVRRGECSWDTLGAGPT
jgi:hypothetical protein